MSPAVPPSFLSPKIERSPISAIAAIAAGPANDPSEAPRLPAAPGPAASRSPANPAPKLESPCEPNEAPRDCKPPPSAPGIPKPELNRFDMPAPALARFNALTPPPPEAKAAPLPALRPNNPVACSARTDKNSAVIRPTAKRTLRNIPFNPSSKKLKSPSARAFCVLRMPLIQICSLLSRTCWVVTAMCWVRSSISVMPSATSPVACMYLFMASAAAASNMFSDKPCPRSSTSRASSRLRAINGSYLSVSRAISLDASCSCLSSLDNAVFKLRVLDVALSVLSLSSPSSELKLFTDVVSVGEATALIVSICLARIRSSKSAYRCASIRCLSSGLKNPANCSTPGTLAAALPIPASTPTSIPPCRDACSISVVISTNAGSTVLVTCTPKDLAVRPSLSRLSLKISACAADSAVIGFSSLPRSISPRNPSSPWLSKGISSVYRVPSSAVTTAPFSLSDTFVRMASANLINCSSGLTLRNSSRLSPKALIILLYLSVVPLASSTILEKLVVALATLSNDVPD